MQLSSYWAHRGHNVSGIQQDRRFCLDCETSVAFEIDSPMPREFRLIRTHVQSIHVAESAELFDITGGRIHNPRAPHKIIGFVGHCCDRESLVHLHMSAQSTAIAAYGDPSERPKRVTVSIGDVLRVDYSYYRLVNRVRQLADPVLIPVQSVKGERFGLWAARRL